LTETFNDGQQLTGTASATFNVYAVNPTLPPRNTVLPAISGLTTIGTTLAASQGTWLEAPDSYTYAWQRCDVNGNACAAIAGATAQSYQLTADDLGWTLRVTVTASNSVGSASATSAPTAPATWTSTVKGKLTEYSPGCLGGKVTGQQTTWVCVEEGSASSTASIVDAPVQDGPLADAGVDASISRDFNWTYNSTVRYGVEAMANGEVVQEELGSSQLSANLGWTGRGLRILTRLHYLTGLPLLGGFAYVCSPAQACEPGGDPFMLPLEETWESIAYFPRDGKSSWIGTWTFEVAANFWFARLQPPRVPRIVCDGKKYPLNPCWFRS
jgi:hypothetical protein